MGSQREADEVGDPHHGGADNRLVVEVLGGDEEDEVEQSDDKGHQDAGATFFSLRGDSQGDSDEGEGKASEHERMALLEFGQDFVSDLLLQRLLQLLKESEIGMVARFVAGGTGRKSDRPGLGGRGENVVSYFLVLRGKDFFDKGLLEGEDEELGVIINDETDVGGKDVGLRDGAGFFAGEAVKVKALEPIIFFFRDKDLHAREFGLRSRGEEGERILFESAVFEVTRALFG